MINHFTKKKIEQHLEQCHASAVACIEMITTTAISQMQVEGWDIEPEDITPELIGQFAAKSLGMAAEQLIKDYTSLMVLEGMVEIVREIHYLEGG